MSVNVDSLNNADDNRIKFKDRQNKNKGDDTFISLPNKIVIKQTLFSPPPLARKQRDRV